jgi:hypothetical protein
LREGIKEMRRVETELILGKQRKTGELGRVESGEAEEI